MALRTNFRIANHRAFFAASLFAMDSDPRDYSVRIGWDGESVDGREDRRDRKRKRGEGRTVINLSNN